MVLTIDGRVVELPLLLRIPVAFAEVIGTVVMVILGGIFVGIASLLNSWLD